LGTDLCPKPQTDPNTRVIVIEGDEFWHSVQKKVSEAGFSRLWIVTVDDSSTRSWEIVRLKPSKNSWLV
jgi:hypothetical protein